MDYICGDQASPEQLPEGMDNIAKIHYAFKIIDGIEILPDDLIERTPPHLMSDLVRIAPKISTILRRIKKE